VLISIRLVRSLVALGRAEDARALAEATLQIRSDLMPLYMDQLELGLAAAECALGRTDEGFARAGRIVERAEARGLSGVLLVDLLAETAVIARAAGEDAVFDALTRRVGDLSATVDSIAFAARYSQLVRVGRASVIDGLANSRSSVPPESIQTSLGVDVRTKLELCRGPNERATRALALLLEHSASSEGFLYLHRQGRLAVAAAIPNVEPAEELDRSVREWLRMTLDTEAATQTASRSQPLTIEPGSSFEIFGIVTAMGGIARVAGVAALRCRYGKLTPVPSAIMSALGEGLVRAGDATPLTTFSGTADPAMPRL